MRCREKLQALRGSTGFTRSDVSYELKMDTSGLGRPIIYSPDFSENEDRHKLAQVATESSSGTDSNPEAAGTQLQQIQECVRAINPGGVDRAPIVPVEHDDCKLIILISLIISPTLLALIRA